MILYPPGTHASVDISFRATSFDKTKPSTASPTTECAHCGAPPRPSANACYYCDTPLAECAVAPGKPVFG